jgi:hypothetical protein
LIEHEKKKKLKQFGWSSVWFQLIPPQKDFGNFSNKKLVKTNGIFKKKKKNETIKE